MERELDRLVTVNLNPVGASAIPAQLDRRYRDLRQLGENEAWDGAVRTELAGFGFNQRVIRSWLEHGNAWDPRRGVSPHSATTRSCARLSFGPGEITVDVFALLTCEPNVE